jgi:hypothetical protein
MTVFKYVSKCCNASATKKACVKSKTARVLSNGTVECDDPASLGKWRCSSCHKPCKCIRTKDNKSLDKG